MQVALDTLKGKVDFAILTIRDDECNAVLDRFLPEHHTQGQRRYEVGELTSDGGRKLSFVVARCVKQGGGEAQRLADYLIQDLDPSLLVLVGICAAVPSADFTLGDVVCATHVHDFSVRAAAEGRGNTFNVGGGEMHYSILSLLGSLPQILRTLPEWNTKTAIGRDTPPVETPTRAMTSRLYGSRKWRKDVRESLARHFPGGTPARTPIATARAVASSDALVKDTGTLQTWLTDARALAAVEMELAGVYLAARTPREEYPILAIRGISDVVGFLRAEAWTAYACHTAASFAYALFRSGAVDHSFGCPGEPARLRAETAQHPVDKTRRHTNAVPLVGDGEGTGATGDPSVALPAATHHTSAHDYQTPERAARQALDAGIATLRHHRDLRAARVIMEDGLKGVYRFSLSDLAWVNQPHITDMVSASRHFRCCGDLLRTQREIELAFRVYAIARRLMASAGSSDEADCERGKLQSSLGESHLRLWKLSNSNDALEEARDCLLDSIRLHEKHPPCWFELFQSERILADVLLSLGDPPGAKAHLDRAEKYWKKSGANGDRARRKLYGWLRRSIGDYLTIKNDLAPAAEEFRTAIDIFTNDADLIGIAVIKRRLAFVSRVQGKGADADSMHAEALRMIKSIPGMEQVHEQFEQNDDTQPDRCGIVCLP